MNNEDLAITALIGSYDGSELEGLEPLKEGEDFFFLPMYGRAIECAKRLGYHNPRDAIRRHCKRETKTVDEIVVTGKRKDGSDAVQVCPPRSSCAEIHLRGGLLPAAVPFPDNTRGAVCRLADGRSAALDPCQRFLLWQKVHIPAPSELGGGEGGKSRYDPAGGSGCDSKSVL